MCTSNWKVEKFNNGEARDDSDSNLKVAVEKVKLVKCTLPLNMNIRS